MADEILVCGIDEAGRGPVIGPMVIACAVLDEAGGKRLKELNVRDSKQVAQSRRIELEPIIKETAVEWKITHVSPASIDRLRKNDSLNQIEGEKMAELIIGLTCEPHQIIVDAADSDAATFKARISAHIQKLYPDFQIPDILSEHKADDKYVEVGAASILAKVERDRAIEKLKEEIGEFGSGYPSDPLTQQYLKKVLRERNGLPDHIRKSWNTVKKGQQTTLGEFD